MMKSLVVCGGLALTLAAASGCTVESHHDYDDGYPPSRTVPSGNNDVTLTVEWTIDGDNDRAVCSDFDVDVAHVELEDDVGLVDEADIPCEDFGYDSPLLPAGTYWATVVLRDADDRDLTTPAQTDARDLYPGDSDYVSVDFPEDSFR